MEPIQVVFAEGSEDVAIKISDKVCVCAVGVASRASFEASSN
jgi:hypothetical protein